MKWRSHPAADVLHDALTYGTSDVGTTEAESISLRSQGNWRSSISAWNCGPVNENAKHLTPLPYQATVAFFFVPRVHRTKATHIVLYRLHQWKGLLLYFFGLFASMNLAIIKMVTIFTRNQEKAQLGNGEGPTCPYIKLRETCHPWPGRNRRSKSTTSLRSCIEHAF